MRRVHKGEGVASINSALCYQLINNDALSSPSLSFLFSVHFVHICSAPNPSNAVSLGLISRHSRRLPSPPSPSLPRSLARCTGDVILFQLDSPPFSLLPPSHSLLRFSPLAAGSPQRSIPSTVASLRGRERRGRMPV